ncbi:hypothetical protein B0H15DRAFT_947866 [Mycena belliarum]|uniref:Uncharacterized protein n=1 Tax=Mycena belliarum TaxID=1033014 RepID=A0AAD6UBG4_9AGAR|nr:hypothetical protein B0H15DRAFT_947866 [Mycena belliae]
MSPPALTLANYPIKPTPRSSASSARSSVGTPWTHTTVVTSTLPKPLPALQPLRKHETLGRAPPRRRPPPPPEGVGWLVVLPGLVVALLSAALATCLLLYLALRHSGDAPSLVHGFYIDEPTSSGTPMWGLLLSTIITNVVWHLGLPVLVSMCAYCIGGAWMSSQQHPPSEQPHLPTPLQYALLFKLLSTPGPASVAQAGTYLAHGRARVPAPAFFTAALVLVASVLGLTYLISLADLWLHAAATVVALPSPSAPSSHPASLAPPPVLRGHYPLPPALAYLALLYLHALLALLLALRTLTLRAPALTPASASATYPAPRAPPALRLAHAHLTNALAPIAARLARTQRPAAAGGGGDALFVEDANSARLALGVWRRDAPPARRRWWEGDVEAGVGGDSGVRASGGESGHSGPGEGGAGGWDWDDHGDGDGQAGGRAGVFGVYKSVAPWKGEIY